MRMTNPFDSWSFDPRTFLITAVAVPLAYFLAKIVVRYAKEIGGYAIEGVLYWATRLIKHSLAGALTLRRFARLQLAGQSRYLFIPSRSDIKAEVDKVFVTLTLERQGGEKSQYTHADLLEVGNRLRIIGDPGSGKSSLVKRLFRDACLEAIRHPRRARLPTLLELKTLKVAPRAGDKSGGDFVYRRLRDDAEASAVYQMGECFDSYARGAGLLVLLDGLDEGATKEYPKIQAAINALSVHLGALSENNIAVLTMRTQFHQQIRDAYRDTFGQALFLRPFTPSDIYEFLSRWPFGASRHANVARI